MLISDPHVCKPIQSNTSGYPYKENLPSDLMVPPAPLMRIESPEQAPEAIKHNAMELLGDRDRLIRFQEKFKPL